MRRIIIVAAASALLSGLFLGPSAASDRPANVRAIERQLAPMGRTMVVPPPAAVSPMAIVVNRDGRFVITINVQGRTPNIVPSSCAVQISNAAATVFELTTGPAVQVSGINYRCVLTTNYNWSGVDDAAPIRIDASANGFDLTFSGMTESRSTSQVQTMGVPSDGAVTQLSISVRL